MSTGFTKKHSNEQVLKEWLSQFKSLSNAALPEYAQSLHEKFNVLTAFQSVLTSVDNDVTANLIQSCCNQLFVFYKSGIQELQNFATSFSPSLIKGYLSTCFSRSKEGSECKVAIATFLLAVYNLLCGVNNGKNDEAANSMEMPNLSKSSVYHDAMMYPFSEHTITVPSHESTYIESPIMKTHEAILPYNRCQILNFVLMSYCDQLSVFPKQSLQQLCSLCQFVGNQGYPWQSDYNVDKLSQKPRRIQVDINLMLTLVRGVYYALYNGCRLSGIKAVEAMQKRSEYELNAQVLILCNAILNTVYQEGDHIREDNPLGVAVALTPMMTRSSSGISRLAVTASSIRHHRWRHTSEEVSGDVSESLHQDATPANPKSNLSATVQDNEDANKVEKHAISPSKLLKNKLKKNVPTPSVGEPQGHKLSGDKKTKKKLSHFSSTEEDGDQPQSTIIPTLEVKTAISSVSFSSLKQLEEEREQRGEELGAKLTSSKSVDIDGVKVKEPVERPSSPAIKKNKSERLKHRSRGESEMKELLSGLKRSGSKKHKENKNPSAAPLLSPNDASGGEGSVSTDL